MIIYILYFNIIWACIVSACVGAGIVLLCFFYANRGKKSLDELKPSPKKDILIGLRDNAESFAELLEPLHLLALGKTGKKDLIFDEWNNRAASLEGYGEFKTAFKAKFGDAAGWKGKNKKYIKKAKKLLKLITKAGIFRSEDIYVKGDENAAAKYDIAGDGFIEADVLYDVFAPYWYRIAPIADNMPDYDMEPEAVVEKIENTEVIESSDEAADADAADGKPLTKRKMKKKAKRAAKEAKQAEKAARKKAKKEAALVNTEEIIILKGIIR